MVTRLDGLKEVVDGDILDVEALKNSVLRDKAATDDLLAMGKDAQQVLKDYGNPVRRLIGQRLSNKTTNKNTAHRNTLASCC